MRFDTDAQLGTHVMEFVLRLGGNVVADNSFTYEFGPGWIEQAWPAQISAGTYDLEVWIDRVLAGPPKADAAGGSG